MATTVTTSVELGFYDGSGKTMSINVQHGQDTPDTEDIVAAMDAIVANSDIFKGQPVRKKYARVKKTTVTDYPIESD